VLDSAFRAVPRTALVLVRVGRDGERVFDDQGRAEAAYEPVLGAAAIVDAVAAATSGSVYSEREARAALGAAVAAVGAGPTGSAGRGARRLPLAPWVLAAAALPLGYLIRRRNLDREG
jgi:hypothetical protein